MRERRWRRTQERRWRRTRERRWSTCVRQGQMDAVERLSDERLEMASWGVV